MFFLTYLRRELRQRRRQAVFIAAGLAVGIGLVVTVTAASAGVNDAQARVLHSLYGIGTDITVTKAPGPPSHEGGGFSAGSSSQEVDVLSIGYVDLLDSSQVASIARLHDVAGAAGGLTLTDTKLTVPSQDQLGPDGQPPASALPTSFTVNGVDVAHLGLGPFANATITSGRTFTGNDTTGDVAIVDKNYASLHNLAVGSVVTIARTPFRVIGIVQQSGSGSADTYIPLRRAQALTQYQNLEDLTGKVNVIYVAASSASAIPAVKADISELVPSATVTTSGSLANQVSGSLASAASLARDLGRWLAVAVLVAAFALASLLTMSAVARRVREIGTLKALGWRGRRIVAQIMGESVITGVIGALLGVAIGFGGAAVVNAIAPQLSATVAQNPGSAPPQNVSINESGMHRDIAPGGTHTVDVILHAPVTATAITLAVLLALAGALIAGTLGGWRAARMRPAAAMARID
jgi:putative ABC transport system permease protein